MFEKTESARGSQVPVVWIPRALLRT